MLFKPELCEKILRGEKTQSRRIVKPGERFIDYLPGGKVVFTEERTKWVVGQTYAIQPGRGKAAIGRFLLLDIRREFVRDISEADAIAEGVEPLESPVLGKLYKPAFVSLWNEINGAGSFGKNPEVWVLTFRLAEAAQKYYAVTDNYTGGLLTLATRHEEDPAGLVSYTEITKAQYDKAMAEIEAEAEQC